MSSSGYLSYSYFRSKLGSSYYIPQSTNADETEEVNFDERSGFNGVPAGSKQGQRVARPTCLKNVLLLFFVIQGFVSGFILYTTTDAEITFDCITALMLSIIAISILGVAGTLHKNGCLLSFVGILLITLSIIFIILIIASTLDFFSESEEFRESTRRVYKMFPQHYGDKRYTYTYLAVVVYLTAHVFLFFAAASIAWILRLVFQ
ncbi:hypothetical protein Q1695_008940 [Nippostrongylus brasiliensis]|nr:hypothetical protein Q1695_008940 [Nippostrongylus brasiliensis]